MYLRFSILGDSSGVVHYLARGVKELDGFVATIERGVVSLQPIHAENKVDGGYFQNVWRNHEF